MDASNDELCFSTAIQLVIGVVLNRKPHTDIADRKDEIFGKHSDHSKRFAVERELAAENTRIGAEATLPRAIADDDDRLRAGLIFTGKECSSALRRDMKDSTEEISGDKSANHTIRVLLAGEVYAL